VVVIIIIIIIIIKRRISEKTKDGEGKGCMDNR